MAKLLQLELGLSQSSFYEDRGPREPGKTRGTFSRVGGAPRFLEFIAPVFDVVILPRPELLVHAMVVQLLRRAAVLLPTVLLEHEGVAVVRGELQHVPGLPHRADA